MVSAGFSASSVSLKSTILASFFAVSKIARVDFPVMYPQISPGLMARVFPIF